ncbi:MAG: NDP-hexose 3,4-dehydratase [Candidatus Azambacteria bacterium GW2011_GWA2_42_9]|uniref:NDP-hexose 3,4-dehydratase n=3 Tax=Candidatus Azamiibacteriota TaxID=1752741 RepID=A0A0G0ZCR6_9BACT|nr:MAG: NDP-hexose 3,4-dehydratase [Candidatus Azambacteria bacterium GW2011_GWB1_42_17]KKS46492.1 MAG: NDP-hexose 3,4-dehydratase [Candidatus Azambacteria bacterium GW2011_GWA1_42_19]KKS75952.1 MAG: NDP-hexose 3,4-dehydratase [Candidatus Azambacteria bacterium GW2011_GWA2_42_9]KKS88723.1 MAG: NDP-hexose 3,4-dehydratase [Parcubacteria group bacterium GW2011_GWC1_43_11]
MNKQAQSKIRVPYGHSCHGKEEIGAVVKVLKNNTALGDHTKEFENKIAKMFGKKYGVMVNSGSSANLLAFELLNLPEGSEVITPILTFATTLAPIVQKRLVPVFVDVDEGAYLVNIKQVEKAITKKTKVLMIPSLMGNIPNMEKLAKLSKKYKLWFIEDSCDTLGGKYNKKPTGVYSHISTTSFYGSHVINGAGGGGMICVNNPNWVDRLVVMRGWGRQSSLFGEKTNSELLKNRFTQNLAGIPYDNKFIFSEVGYNFLPLELSSAFALEQLKKFPAFKEIRKRNFSELYKFFSKYNKYFTLAAQTPQTETVWLAFPLTIRENAPFTRLELITFLEKNNIQTRPIFTGNVLKQPGFKKITHRLAQKNYPNAERIMRNALVVGCHQGLAPNQIAYLKTKFIEFLSNYK